MAACQAPDVAPVPPDRVPVTQGLGRVIGGATQQFCPHYLLSGCGPTDSFARRTGRAFTADERDALLAVQRQATRWTFLGSGITHRNFLATIGALRPAVREAVEHMVPMFS